MNFTFAWQDAEMSVFFPLYSEMPFGVRESSIAMRVVSPLARAARLQALTEAARDTQDSNTPPKQEYR